MKRIIFLLGTLMPIMVTAQVMLKPLSVGDTLPSDYLPKQITTSPKLIILDFFATWCSSCFKSFPLLDSLQLKYPSEMQLVLVSSTLTGDNKQKLTEFFNRRKRSDGSPYSFPIVADDTLLTASFPHKLLPHYVWLDSGRKVIAITDAASVTVTNIERAIKGDLLNLSIKRDITDYDSEKALLEDSNGGSRDAVRFRSLFTGFLTGLPTGTRQWRDSMVYKTTWLNFDILSLYQLSQRIAGNRLLLDVKDPELYFSSDPSHRYCYELTVPLSTSSSQRVEMARQDLNRYLNLNGRWEKRSLECWVLKLHDSLQLRTAGGKPLIKWANGNDHTTIFRNQPLRKLVVALNTTDITLVPAPIIVDETEYEGHVDLEIRSPITDLPALSLELKKIGISLSRSSRSLEVFVITDVPAAMNTKPL